MRNVRASLNLKSYDACEAYLNGKQNRPAGNNTRVIRRFNATICIRLHGTDIVTYHRDGTVEVDSGGWKTRTTKDRINQFTSLMISQKDHVWYCRGLNDIEFTDGMKFHESRNVQHA